MHNSYPQLGFFHKGLGTYVYNDAPQMGSLWTDLRDALTGGVKSATQQAEDRLKDTVNNVTPSIKNTVMSYFLDTPTGERLVAEAKEGWLAQQTENARVFYINNKGTINMALVGVGAVVLIGALWKARSSGYKAAAKRAAAPMAVPFSGAAPAAATNPRRRKRKMKKHYRRKRK
jgi:hypothetical protein